MVCPPDCARYDEILLDTGCSFSVLSAAQLEIRQEQPDSDYEDIISTATSRNNSDIVSISESMASYH